VSFEIVKGPKGELAQNIRAIDSPASAVSGTDHR
jgi:hypothetical protein